MEENTPDIPPRAAHTLCTALSVAGSDSCGGAGIQADLKTFSALGVYGMTAVTALTAQNTRGVQAVFPAGEACLRAQLEAVLSDVRPGAVKVGMVFGRAQVEILADALEAYRPAWVVYDPVMVSSSGASRSRSASRWKLARSTALLIETSEVVEARSSSGSATIPATARV